jgi:hypothetical protein
MSPTVPHRAHTAPSPNQPNQDKLNEISVDTRTEDNIVDDILSAEDDYMTLNTQNGLLNSFNSQSAISSNVDNMTQIEFLKDMNHLHMLDDELFYNDIDFESFQNNQMFNMSTNDMDYGANDRNAEVLFDFVDCSRGLDDQDLINAFTKAETLPEELLNVPEVNFNEKPSELLDNPCVSVNECATIFESDVDLEASTNLAANLNQLIGENSVQYISTEDDDTFIISLKSEIDAEQLSDMLNIGVELVEDNKGLVEVPPDNVSDADTSESFGYSDEPIVIKLEEPSISTNAPTTDSDEKGKKQVSKKQVKKQLLFVCRHCKKVFNKRDNYKSHVGKYTFLYSLFKFF